MKQKNSYPEMRKPAEKVRCKVCGKYFAARGIVIHLRMTHGITEKIEVIQSHTHKGDFHVKSAETIDKSEKDGLNELKQMVYDLGGEIRNLQKPQAPKEIINVRPDKIERLLKQENHPEIRQKETIGWIATNIFKPIDLNNRQEIERAMTFLEDHRQILIQEEERYRENPILQKIDSIGRDIKCALLNSR